ncbi:MAG: hypothetical protein CBB68_00200 [Rhodospirillaceae bacterium TMED8]|nr:MAG: hypothetical protein CBB68_00200 [Rhodospirillaceae bacterium TMED8]
MVFQSAFVKQLLESEPSKPSKLGFEGFEGVLDKENPKKDEESMVLDQILQKTIAEGSILYQCESSDQANSWCAILKQKLPDDREVCVIRKCELNTFTLHIS